MAAFIALLFLPATLTAQGPYITRSLSLSLYDHVYGTNLVLSCEAALSRTDLEKGGFFKIGLLPVMIWENVRLKVYDPAGLKQVETWLNGSGDGSARVQIRELVVLLGDEHEVLSARTGVFRNGSWYLQDVRAKVGGRSIQLPSARMQTGGDKPGAIYSTDARYLGNVFGQKLPAK